MTSRSNKILQEFDKDKWDNHKMSTRVCLFRRDQRIAAD